MHHGSQTVVEATSCEHAAAEGEALPRLRVADCPCCCSQEGVIVAAGGAVNSVVQHAQGSQNLRGVGPNNLHPG